MYAKPKNKLRETNGSGVILDVEWFAEDPTANDDVRPVLIDSILIPAPNARAVTDEMIEDAIAKRLGEVEVELAPTEEPTQKVKALLGKVHDAVAVRERVQQRRAAR